MSHDGHAIATEIRAQVGHPIIDGDGHWLEFGPAVRDRLRRIGGDRAAEGFAFFTARIERELAMTVAERRHHRVAQPPWWAYPTRNTRDRATALMPRLRRLTVCHHIRSKLNKVCWVASSSRLTKAWVCASKSSNEEAKFFTICAINKFLICSCRCTTSRPAR